MKNSLSGALVACLALLNSCGEPYEGYKSSLTGGNTENEWIYDVMRENYLWNDYMKKYTAYDTRTSDAETFFYSLISSEEKKTSSSGSEYCYSYIEQATKTKLITNNGYSYGIYFISYNFDKASKIWPRILYVIPGSPADLAGVKRGDWIVSVDNASSVDPYSVISGNAATWGIYKGTPHLANMQNPAYISYKSVGASVLIDENPILKDTVLVYDNKKVAYLNYLSFQTGPDGFEDKSWETELKNVFSRFKAENADELILDLRFNGGGYLSTANVLASMIVPEKNLDKAFCKLKYNDDQKYKNSTVYFNSNLLDYNLGIGRVYILTSEFTASASEAVLNGLKAANYMEVIQMGSTTEGKNLGSVEYDSEKYDWVLHPIVSSIVNADDFGDYFNGITPDAQYYWDDININEYGYQYMGDLGSDDDPLIYNALENMGISLDNASSQRRQISKSDSYDFGNVKRTGSYVLNKKYNSVIID